jgi:P-type conjugative transfer protein TrbG
MNRTALVAAASALALSACAGPAAARQGTAPAASFTPARQADDPRALQATPSALPGQEAPAAERVEAEKREPGRRGAGAAMVHAWREGALYRLPTAPERVSEIALQPGETLISVAAGDTVRWVIGDTTSGSGSSRRTHILVKPSESGLRTNLIIATDRRVYHLELRSEARGSMPSLSWTYPEDELLALRRSEAAAVAATSVSDGLTVEALNFGYRIEGDSPDWRPVRAFDDGRQVFIEFPAGLAASEAPPLFLLGADGGAELVNYRLRGRYYVVDRLFTAAELRLGQKRQQVVRITRSDVTTKNRRRGRSS